MEALLAWIERWIGGEPPENVWLGATVVNQEEADRDIPKLLAVPARVRFLSVEPMLGPIDLRRIVLHSGPLDLLPTAPPEWHGVKTVNIVIDSTKPGTKSGRPAIDWVICGGESGPKARPMHPEWARSLRDQCASAGVAFHFKQWGEWGPTTFEANRYKGPSVLDGQGDFIAFTTFTLPNGRQVAWSVVKVGKAAAGRLLDGRTHDEFPLP